MIISTVVQNKINDADTLAANLKADLAYIRTNFPDWADMESDVIIAKYADYQAALARHAVA